MSKKIILINADHPEECRAVILENGKVDQFVVEHATREQIKGNVYLGVINRVEPAIEAAFVDYGGKKYGFLPFKDVQRDSYLQTGERKAKIRIQDVLVRGQKILVQVVKEERETKGPSLTNSVSIPGRFLVLVWGSDSSGVSRKIEDESERKKLKSIISNFKLPDNTGLIIRTAGLGRTKPELQKDLNMLMKIRDQIERSIKDKDREPPFLVYRETDMVVRTVRDHFTNDTSEIIVDNPVSYKALKDFMKLVMPRMSGRVKLYQEIEPLFSRYNVEEQIESLYNRKVLLPSGGSVVFDIGEAMVSIDVNSGKTTSASALEETAVQTNLEAANEIARQLHLRDLGGLIVIDFIDMFQKKNKALVEKELKQACKNDKARINMSRISRFGLLEMSRQRISPPVKEGVFEQCDVCRGTGHVKSMSTLALGVLRKIQEILATGRIRVLSVEISPEISDYLLNNKIKFLQELQEKHKFRVNFVSRAGITAEEFKYSVVERGSEEAVVTESRVKEGRFGDREDSRGAPKTREGPVERKSEGRPRGRTRKSATGKSHPRKPSSTKRRSTSRGRKRGPAQRVSPPAGREVSNREELVGAVTEESGMAIDNPVLKPEVVEAGPPVVPALPQEAKDAEPAG